ncbi:diguanylate cyclase [Butyrivibrio sp. X503]|uniref:diguanylate cyclase n=1 Tax=Butyrivibrio sp. X503 TaxID=2364878 RepID=UPI000EA9B64B|nr:diguanylate cyclase [Butyrivibrio sp. X503]RKM53895.1 diguanylate cyclase [Butyrivibrio sp. X503]
MISDQTFGVIAYNLSALIVSVTCIIYKLIIPSRLKLRNRLFNSLIIILAIDAFSAIYGEIIRGYDMAHETALFLRNLNEMLYFATHFAIAPIIARYTMLKCGVEHKIRGWRSVAVHLPFLISEFMILTNPWFHLIYSIDNNLVYTREWGVYVVYIIGGLYFILSAVFIFLYWDLLKRLEQIAIIYFYVLVLIGTLIQMVFSNISCELLCDAIGAMGMMVILENDDDRRDYTTKAYNRNALINDMMIAFKYKRPFDVIFIDILNEEILRRLLTYADYEKILSEVVKFLKSINDKFDVYRVGVNSFFVVCPEISEKKAKKVADEIYDRFKEFWTYSGKIVTLNARVIQAGTEDGIADLDKLFKAHGSGKNIDKDGPIFFDEL